jgi:hypothetical protein
VLPVIRSERIAALEIAHQREVQRAPRRGEVAPYFDAQQPGNGQLRLQLRTA